MITFTICYALIGLISAFTILVIGNVRGWHENSLWADESKIILPIFAFIGWPIVLPVTVLVVTVIIVGRNVISLADLTAKRIKNRR